MSQTLDQAYRLLQNQQAKGAMQLLVLAGEGGDADAYLELAVWTLTGQALPRDLRLARLYFGKAGALGHERASEIYRNLLANGTGGTRDWLLAKNLLASHAERSPLAASQLSVIEAMQINELGHPLMAHEASRLSASPDVCLVHNFLTEAECTYLITRAEPLFQPSMVVDPASGRLVPNPVRTSDNAEFPWVEEDLAIHALNQRIAALTGFPVENGEPLQVLRYRGQQEYRSHLDALPATENQRMVTVLLYLNDDYAGGETRFSRCGLNVKGQRGDALVFANAHASGRPDLMAQHAGLPVRSGEKLLATRWIRRKTFGPPG